MPSLSHAEYEFKNGWNLYGVGMTSMRNSQVTTSSYYNTLQGIFGGSVCDNNIVYIYHPLTGKLATKVSYDSLNNVGNFDGSLSTTTELEDPINESYWVFCTGISTTTFVTMEGNTSTLAQAKRNITKGWNVIASQGVFNEDSTNGTTSFRNTWPDKYSSPEYLFESDWYGLGDNPPSNEAQISNNFRPVVEVIYNGDGLIAYKDGNGYTGSLTRDTASSNEGYIFLANDNKEDIKMQKTSGIDICQIFVTQAPSSQVLVNSPNKSWLIINKAYDEDGSEAELDSDYIGVFSGTPLTQGLGNDIWILSEDSSCLCISKYSNLASSGTDRKVDVPINHKPPAYQGFSADYYHLANEHSLGRDKIVFQTDTYKPIIMLYDNSKGKWNEVNCFEADGTTPYSLTPQTVNRIVTIPVIKAIS